MKIKTWLQISNRRDKVVISIEDRDAGIKFCEIELTPEQFVQALSNANVEVDGEVMNIDKIGKKMEHKPHEFELTRDIWQSDKLKEHARAMVLAKLKNTEWEPDLHFYSQDSFFTKDGKKWVRTTIRRWIDKEKKDDHKKREK